MMHQVVDVTTTPATGQKVVLLFWVSWRKASTEGGPIDQLLRDLAQIIADGVLFGRVQVEECRELAREYNVNMYPTIVLLDTDGQVVEKLEGGEDVAQVKQSVQAFLQEEIRQHLQRLIQSSEVLLFIKGMPRLPRCKLSRQAVRLLQDERIPFESFDVLTNDVVRQGLETYSGCPTYPQLYVRGEFVGGSDVMRAMKEEEGGLRRQSGIRAIAARPIFNPPLRFEMTENRSKETLFLRHDVMLTAWPDILGGRRTVRVEVYGDVDMLVVSLVIEGVQVASNRTSTSKSKYFGLTGSFTVILSGEWEGRRFDLNVSAKSRRVFMFTVSRTEVIDAFFILTGLEEQPQGGEDQEIVTHVTYGDHTAENEFDQWVKVFYDTYSFPQLVSSLPSFLVPT